MSAPIPPKWCIATRTRRKVLKSLRFRDLFFMPGKSSRCRFDGLATVKGKGAVMAAQNRLFLREYTVYVFSRKNNLPDSYSIREMADDQAEAMRTLGIGKASVVGVSEGGIIAQHLAADHADMVEKLVIAVSAPYANGTVRANVKYWIELAKQGNHKQLMTDIAEKYYSEAFLSRYRKLYPIIGTIGKPDDYHRFLVNAEAILGFDARNDVRRISCPVLIIAGGDDRIVGTQAANELNGIIPGSRLHVYPGLGHGAYEEAKDLKQRIYDFLEDVSTV